MNILRIMVVSMGKPDLLVLRRQVAKLDNSVKSFCGHHAPLPLGIDAIDAVLDGGLAGGALHEMAPVTHLHLGAAAGFAVALAARTDTKKSVLWIQPGFAGVEGGGVF